MSNNPRTTLAFTRRQCLLVLGASIPVAAGQRLKEVWSRIAATTDGTVGGAAVHLPAGSAGSLTSLNGDESFPLASICKIPIAMNILALVDERKLALNDQIEVLARDVWAGVSDIEKRWPKQRHFSLAEMVDLMVTKSDNTAVETLFRIGGGGAAIARRLRVWNIVGMRVDRSERQCALDRNGVTHYPPPTEWTDKVLEDLINPKRDDPAVFTTVQWGVAFQGFHVTFDQELGGHHNLPHSD